MKKENGKEIYTFVGLLNRMESCRNRDYRFTEKDIPESVEFMGTEYTLSDDKRFYYNRKYDSNLCEAVADAYGEDVSMFLTAYDFIVTPKEKIFLTAEEKEFIRICNAILRGGMGIESIYISTDTFDKLLCMRFKDDKQLYVPIGMHAFDGMSAETEYALKDLKIYE